MSGAPTQHTSARYLPIAEHGLIADLRTAALVGNDGPPRHLGGAFALSEAVPAARNSSTSPTPTY